MNFKKVKAKINLNFEETVGIIITFIFMILFAVLICNENNNSIINIKITNEQGISETFNDVTNFEIDNKICSFKYNDIQYFVPISKVDVVMKIKESK